MHFISTDAVELVPPHWLRPVSEVDFSLLPRNPEDDGAWRLLDSLSAGSAPSRDGATDLLSESERAMERLTQDLERSKRPDQDDA